MKRFIRMLPALVVTAAVAWATGCGIETQVVGVVVDEDLNDLPTMMLLARGTNSELTDIFAASNYARRSYTVTDEAMEGASTSQTTDHRYAASDYHDRIGGSSYSQAMEASWAGILSAQRIESVDIKEGVDPATDPLIARMWLNAGLAERQLGEMFCNATYNFGPDGGMLLNGPGDYDPSIVVTNDSIFRRVINFADRAIEVAQAGVAAGAEVPEGWYLFDPQVVLTSAYGLKAQAYLILEEWAMADQFATLALSQPAGTLPPSAGNIQKGGSGIDYVEFTHYNDDTEDNDTHYEMHRDDEVGLWNSAIANNFEGDPRVPFVRCGEFKDGVTPGGSQSSSNFHDYSTRAGCRLEFTRAEYRIENNRYPRYVQLKYVDRGSDYEMVTGTEMVLIKAEVALRAGDMAAFETLINEHRAFWSLPPLAESDPQAFPLVAGALEYPNAEDDAWSILDRERLLDLWLEGRRRKDMERWNHPYWTEGNYATPEQADLGGGGPRPYMCFPLPSNECGSNETIRTTDVCAKLDPPGG